MKLLRGCVLLVLFITVGVFVALLVGKSLVGDCEEKDFDLKDNLDFSYVQEQNDKDTTSNITDDTNNNEDNTEVTVSDIIDNVMPGIVAITSKNVRVEDSLFFGSFETESVSVGSGIIISYNSHEILIATNYHVIESSSDITVTFFDEEIVTGQVKGEDKSSDLAVISVKKADIPTETIQKIRVAALGDTSKLRVGETVIAVGNAMGYGNSVTTGILSAKDREIDISDSKVMKLLQTDAAINPGNSGGALINLKGEVIGINSIKYVSAYTERVGYAIPIDTAIPILNELINYDEVNEEDRGYLGFTGRDVNDGFASRFGAPYGVYVYEIEEDSPAMESGLLTGDIIVSFNGVEVKTTDEIYDILKYKRVGDVCTLDIYRFEKGKYVSKKIEVELGEKR